MSNSKNVNSQKAIRTMFADSATSFLTSADEHAQRAQAAQDEVIKKNESTESVRLYRHSLRLEVLQNLSDNAVKFLQSIKISADSLQTIVESAMYSKDKIVRILESAGNDTVLNSIKTHENVGVFFELIQSTGKVKFTSREIKRQFPSHSGMTQTHYIERTLQALGIATRTKIESGIYETELNADSPLAKKLLKVYGIK